MQWHWLSRGMQPVRPGRKIYSAPCTKCGGKGRITMPQTEAALHSKCAFFFSVYQPPLFSFESLRPPQLRPISFLAAPAVSAFPHCGRPVQRAAATFMAKTVLRLRYSTKRATRTDSRQFTCLSPGMSFGNVVIDPAQLAASPILSCAGRDTRFRHVGSRPHDTDARQTLALTLRAADQCSTFFDTGAFRSRARGNIRAASQFVGDHRWFASQTGNDADGTPRRCTASSSEQKSPIAVKRMRLSTWFATPGRRRKFNAHAALELAASLAIVDSFAGLRNPLSHWCRADRSTDGSRNIPGLKYRGLNKAARTNVPRLWEFR